jgi:hypothetical protein
MKCVVTLLGSLALLTGCATAGGPATDTFCQIAQPIVTSRSMDKLTDKTAEQIEAHNEVGAKLCGW